MSEIDRNFIRECIHDEIIGFVCDEQDTEKIVDAIVDDVEQDIVETADPAEWHGGDVCMAMTRVLKKRLGIE